MASAAVIAAEQIPGADLLPTWVVHSPPWEVPKSCVRTQRGPAGAVDAPTVGAVAGGAVGCGVHCPGGVGFPELCQGGLHTFFRGTGGYGGDLFLVGLCAVDVDGVDSGIVGHTKVHRPADVPEPNVVAAADTVGDHIHSLAVHVDGLGAQCGGELLDGGVGGAAQGETGEDADPHKDRFSFPVHDDSPFGLLCLMIHIIYDRKCR